MNNFYSVIAANNFYVNPKDKKMDIYNRYSHLTRFINFNITKNELTNLVKALHTYVISKDDTYKLFKFGQKDVIPNDEQHRIITAFPTSHYRIISCSGSGKTTTILCRVKFLLENYTFPEKILILTFNKDACENLKNRIKDLFGFDIKIEIRTVDSFAAKIYYQHNTERKYCVSLSEYGSLALKILKQHGGKICKQYEYIFFDEFQDISDIQFNTIKIYAENGSFLSIIGDDQQNIYQWRDSDNYYIINFDNILKNTITFPMSVNYRCNESIVRLANKALTFNENRIKKDMFAHRTNILMPKLVLFENLRSQFKEIIKIINNITNTQNINQDNFAVLARNNLYLKLFEEYLCKYNKKNTPIKFVSLISDDKNDTKQIIAKDHLTISTIHKSKGLEWYCVFLIGLSDEFFPCFMNNSFYNIEEERRLYYVATTRAIEYLYLMVNTTELPLSRFIEETKSELEYLNASKIKIFDDIESVLGKDNTSKKKLKYSVTELIKLLKPRDYEELREQNLIQDINPDVVNLFDKELQFNENIKINNFESDFGDFCDRLLSRKITENTKHDIEDAGARTILETIYLDKKEMELFNKYELKNLIDSSFNKKEILNKIMTESKYSEHATEIVNFLIRYEKLQRTPIRDNTFPQHFLNKIRNSYCNYVNKKYKSSDILEDIYNVSLCGKCCDNRRRLVYRNIFDIYMQDFEEINLRINTYCEIMKDFDNICKVNVKHVWSNKVVAKNEKKEEFTILGELDMINITNGVLIDFKCSNSDFKTEWYIQLLLYYSLLKINDSAYNINKLMIFNVLKGKTYEINVENYDHDNLIKYFCKMVEDEINPNNKKKSNLDIKLLLNNNVTNHNNIKELIIKKKLEENINATYYMVLDTETTGLNIYYDDILQLAYNIYDEKYDIIKQVNMYTKNEFCAIQNSFIHGIDDKVILEKGIKFNDAMDIFIKDLHEAKFVIGHNIKFDLSMIESNMFKYKYNYIDIFKTKNVLCTKKIGFGIYRTSEGKRKIPSLMELYVFLFKEKFEGAHNAVYDVDACARCFFLIENRKNVLLNMKTVVNSYKSSKKLYRKFL